MSLSYFHMMKVLVDWKIVVGVHTVGSGHRLMDSRLFRNPVGRSSLSPEGYACDDGPVGSVRMDILNQS
jgi:hypothetical protein